LEEVPPPTDGPSYFCKFCLNGLDPDAEDTYHEVKSWVNGPKLDGPKLRERTGRLAHKSCIDLLVAGQDPIQPRLFEPDEPGVYKEVHLGKLDHLPPPSIPPLYDGKLTAEPEIPEEEPYDPSANYDF
jgi:hypothetical protein